MTIYRQNEVDSFLKAWSNKSREELLMLKEQKSGSPLIAINILLDRLDEQDKEKKHKENLDTARQANTLSRWAIFIAILSLVVAIIALFYKAPEEKPKAELQKPISTAAPVSNATSPTQPEKANTDKQ